MSRLTPLDRVLVLLLVPSWLGLFGLSMALQVQGRGSTLLGLSVEGPDAYPSLTGQYSAQYSADPLAAAGLRRGDRLLRVGGADLRGVDTFDLYVLVPSQVGRDSSVTLAFERDGERRTTSLELIPPSRVRPLLVASFALAISALLLLLRARPTPSVRAYFYMGMCAAFGCVTQNPSAGHFLPGRLPGYVVEVGIGALSFAAFMPLLMHFLHLFPDDHPPDGRLHRVWPWLFAPPLAGFLVLAHTGWIAVGDLGLMVSGATAAGAALVVATRKYRSADPVARRQMKWAMFGTYCSLLPIGVAIVVAALEPRLGWLAYASFGGLALLPLFLLVSVSRFNLFDIDRILSTTASYNILGVALGTGALVLVPRIAQALSDAAGIDAGTGQAILSLALASVVVPAHRRLRPELDRLLFKDRFALESGISDLLPMFAECSDASSLTRQAGQGLNRLIRPDGCAVYGLVEGAYVPIFVEGRAVPPAFDAESPLVETLRKRRRPLHLGNVGRRADEASLDPFDRAALATLDAEVVLPVGRNDVLAAFVCLGPKRSGDVYTSTDLSHLTTIAEALAGELRRFDQEETVREARAMQESLRRYVPGAVAERLSSGAELTSSECEVSVLFVDIRGYTSFSESRKAEEIFSTVNLYTESVSKVVRKHAGSVVEFNGDGMMVVFGAPVELDHKERAAVEAGREIVDAVGSLLVDDPAGGHTRLTVGVGIATGTAFVGNIQAVDRLIWSAIGNTTNLAARLQSLTRELDATLVIDRCTWERSGPLAGAFQARPGVPIRGRRETQDVYVLPGSPDA